MSYDFAAATRHPATAEMGAMGATHVFHRVEGTEHLGVNVGSRGLSGVLEALQLPVQQDGMVELDTFRARLAVASHDGDPLIRQYLGDLFLLVETAWTRGARDAWITWG